MSNIRQELVRKISIALLMLITPIGLLFFLAWDIGRRAEATAAQRQQLADRAEELILYAKLQSQSVEAEPYLSVLQNVLPARDQLFIFPKEMENLAAQQGVGFGFNFSNETPQTNTGAGRIGFVITTEGSLLKIFNFIKSMEDSRFLIDFKNFDFTGSTVNINGEVLFYNL